MLSIGSKEVNALYCYDKEVNHLDLSDSEVYDSNIPEYLKTFKKVTTITKDLVESLNIQDIEEVIIPKNITKIYSDAFIGCANLQKVLIKDIAAWCHIDLTGIYQPQLPSKLYLNGKPLGDLVLPNTVKSISTYAFFRNSSLSSVIIPTSVTEIEAFAFWLCSSLHTVILPNSVKVLSGHLFQKTALTNITIPEGVTTIETYAFAFCRELKDITIPSSVTKIVDNPFIGCSGIGSIVINNSNSKYDSRENCNAIIESATNKLIVGCKNTAIPNSVTSIRNYAFSGCSGLTSVTIPNSVTSIGDYAFEDCSGLTSVTIPDSVTSISSNAFNNCNGLTNVEVGQDFNTPLYISAGNYTPEVMVNVFENLKDLTGATSKRLTLGTKNLTKLTDAQKAIATNKNWKLA